MAANFLPLSVSGIPMLEKHTAKGPIKEIGWYHESPDYFKLRPWDSGSAAPLTSITSRTPKRMRESGLQICHVAWGQNPMASGWLFPWPPRMEISGF